MNEMPENPAPKEIDLSGVRYVISDWDGTLVDSMPKYTQAFSSVLKERYNIQEKDSKDFFTDKGGGKALSYQMTEAARQYAGVSIEDPTELEEAFWEKLEQETFEVIPGASELLEKLKEKGYTVIVWSGSKTQVVGRVAEQLGIDRFIDFYIGNEQGKGQYVKGKGLFQVITEHFGITQESMAQQTLVVGDMVGDIEAGREIGAITGGFGRTNDPKFKDADFTFETPQELLSRLIS